MNKTQHKRLQSLLKEELNLRALIVLPENLKLLKIPGDTLSKLKSPPKTANTTSSVSALVLAARKVANTSLA